MTVTQQHLLFFDTFSHETVDVAQLDLVQFPRAVQVSEIRVIPLGARVKADFPGGFRLGATNPSTFEIEFFINDLSKRGAATFEKIGKLQYSQHGSIQLEFDKKPPTDGLLLRGNYNTITLAVYGSLTKVQREPSPPKAQARPDTVPQPPQPPPEKVNTHERIKNWLEDTKRKQHDYELNPSEEDPPDWEPKPPRSPVDFESGKVWVENTESNREGSKEKRSSFDRSQSREKSWEKSERSSTKKESKREISREKEKERDREQLTDIDRTTKEREKENELENKKSHHRGSREKYEDELLPYDIHVSRRGRSVDEWEDRRSARSEEVPQRRPQTPIEPAEPIVPLLENNYPPSNSAFSEDGDENTKSNALPAPMIAGEMEAISDDEELLDLPPPEVDEENFGHIEEEDPMVPLVEQALAEEAIEETEGFEYEEIMSDEDDLPEYQYEDYIVEEWEDWIKPFTPQDLLELPELLYFNSPAITEYEKESRHWKSFANKLDKYEDNINSGKSLLSVVETSLPSPLSNRHVDGDLSQDIPEETGELWVQAAEQVCQLLPNSLVYLENCNDIIQKLFLWVECGLDFDMALNQQQPVFKIRHMKVGIRLTTLLLQCNSTISSSLLNSGIVDKLFLLNDQPHLALSIRLMIFRCLDAITDTPSGLQYFIYDKTGNGKTTYERVLQLISSLQQSRAKVALSAIVRKIHILEVCEKFRADTFALLDMISENDDELVSKKDQLPSDKLSAESDEVMDIEEQTTLDQNSIKEETEVDLRTMADVPVWQCNVPPSLLDSIVSCLKEILRTYTYANQLLVQPNRWLPGSKQFQLPKVQQNPYPFLYIVFDMIGLLENLSVMLVTPALCQHTFLFSMVKALITSLIANEHGIRYLSSERKSTMLIIKALLQYGEDGRENSSDGLCQFGIQLSFIMHVIHQLDCISQLGVSSKRRKTDGGLTYPDYSQAVVHFHSLESILMSPVGKEAIVLVLGNPFFTEILFPYLSIEAGEDHESNPTKAACFGYSVDLLTIVVKFQDNPQLLEKYADQICSFIPSEEKLILKLEEFNKLFELKSWVSIAKNSEIFSYDKLSNLCNVVQENLEKIEKIPGELITALRILCYLTIPAAPVSDIDSEEHNNELIEELKYKYATIQLFSADLLTHLVNILSKLFGIYQQPFLHSSNFVGTEGGLVVMLIKPTLALLKHILSQVIQVRNTEFKDLTAVWPLVQTYILLQAIPASSSYIMVAHELQQEVISILLGYTQVIYTTEGEEVLSKSLWTQMMAEIFKYVMTAPHTMVCVITLVTELLPLPLPIQTHFPLSEEENMEAVKVRKLWSAHLYSLAPTLHELIHRLGLATYPLLTHSLRRMCVALSDLSAPMALLVAKATLDLVLQTHRLDQRTQAKEESKGTSICIKEEVKSIALTAASQQTARALNMLASLVSHAPTKIAVLHLLKGGSPTLTTQTPPKTEEKYCSLLPTWCKILSLPIKVSPHIAAQECLVTVYQYLLEHENAMQVNCNDSQDGTSGRTSPQFSYSGVPHKDILLPMIEALIDVIRNSSAALGIIQHSLKVLSRLIEHNYGFFYVKSVMDMKKGCLYPVLLHLSSNFNRGRPELVTVIQDLLNFCHLLISPFDDRTYALSVSELALHIYWRTDNSDTNALTKSLLLQCPLQDNNEMEMKKEDDKTESDRMTEEGEITIKEEIKEKEMNCEKIHPIKILEQLVVTEVGEEETMESLYEEISHLISLLEQESPIISETCDFEEPPPVGLESLQVLFGNRIVWTFPTLDDDLHSLWLSSPPFEEMEERDVVSVNLLETCRKYASNFDLIGTLHKLVKGQASHSISPQKFAKAVPKYKPSAAAIRPNQRGTPYVAPMRGRSFGRQINIRSDPFRSRPPNTSRPPSLHVDDFVALESTGHQPTGPTGYNKISFGRGKMMLDSMRGSRGRTRGDGRGGRFFHRPPFRGDGGRGMGRGIGMRRGPGWAFRGDGSPRGNFRGGPMNQMPPRYIRGRPFARGMPGLKDRFPQKFMERGRRGDGSRHMRGFR